MMRLISITRPDPAEPLPLLPDEPTLTDLAQAINAWQVFGAVSLLVIVFLLAIIAFRGK